MDHRPLLNWIISKKCISYWSNHKSINVLTIYQHRIVIYIFAGLTHEEVLAQGLLFFLAGYETTANTMALLAYCLATNQECQDKLLKEIDDVTKNNVCYYVINSVNYVIISIIN